MNQSSAHFTHTAIVPQSETEALILQHAIALYRDTKTLADDAPHGQFLNVAEATICEKAREFIRTSLQSIVQEKVNEIEKKNETRLCKQCRAKKRHRGKPKKQIETAAGQIKIKRRYDECMPCKLKEHVADAIVGLNYRYTLGLRSLACYAGAGNSFEQAEKDLKFYRGLDISHMTIRELCNEEAPKMEEWFEQSQEVQQEFIAAQGNVEVTLDGTCVNTTAGAKEVKVCILSKRKLGESALPAQWGTRVLPPAEPKIAFAAVMECGDFKEWVNHWRSRLRLGSTGDISALGDGAVWLWNIIKEVFGKVRECLDVYHGLEHVSDTGKVLYGDGTEAYKKWYELATLEFLESGFDDIEKRLDILELEQLSERQRESVRLLRGYLEGHRHRLCYCERLLEGRAIGSGQVEGACKHLIGARLKQTWARWLPERLNRMATMCAIRYSNQWEKYWMQAK